MAPNTMPDILDGRTPKAALGNCLVYALSPDELVDVSKDLLSKECELKMITAQDDRVESETFHVLYLWGVPKRNLFVLLTIPAHREFPSLTPLMHRASIFERKIYTLFGLVPVGHPDVRTLILHENWPDGVYPLRKDFVWNTRLEHAQGEFAFRRVDGEGIYEIPVGPVHAGIIEPGHFRFSVLGEEIILLEPRLGYSHRGVEKLFETLSLEETLRLSERISGDSSFSHSLAYCQAIESLCGIAVPKRAEMLRVVYAELERLANHLGDIGAIMLDTGFNFGGAHGARLREVVMRIHERLCGNRFLRGVNTFGGVTRDISTEQGEELLRELSALEKDFSEVVAIAEGNALLIDRLQGTGVLSLQIAKDHGVVGVPARAVGISVDARIDYPYAAYKKLKFDCATENTGDVYARFFVRVKEVRSSFSLLQQALSSVPGGSLFAEHPAHLPSNAYAVGIVEGWRGEIATFVATDSSGHILHADVRDPSFLNWTVLGHAGKGNMVPDFPLINKSFNLSYAGNDL